MNTITTAGEHGLVAGDAMTWPIYLSRLDRLRLWLARPGWYWPPRRIETQYVITAVTDGNTFEIDKGTTPFLS